jgi:hypothetical protein
MDANLGHQTPLIRIINKDSDIVQYIHELTADFAFDADTEDVYIARLLSAFNNYPGNVNYFMIPEDFNPPCDVFQYNSNSFAHGLLNAAGLGSRVGPVVAVPDSLQPGSVTGWSLIFPGWNSPLPASCFTP